MSNTQDGAWLDIAANSVWGGRFQRTYFDVRVLNPHAPSNRHTQMSACYRKHKRAKKRAYEQRIREVAHASFTPLVLSATGGLAIEAISFYKRLASLLASKWDSQYCTTMAWYILPSTIGHTMHQGSSVEPWTCNQVSSSA